MKDWRILVLGFASLASFYKWPELHAQEHSPSMKRNPLHYGVVDTFVLGLRDELLPYLRSAAFGQRAFLVWRINHKRFAAAGMVKSSKWSSRALLDEPMAA